VVLSVVVPCDALIQPCFTASVHTIVRNVAVLLYQGREKNKDLSLGKKNVTVLPHQVIEQNVLPRYQR
jgi:hypothetical protein